jgi:hypothetical protein
LSPLKQFNIGVRNFQRLHPTSSRGDSWNALFEPLHGRTPKETPPRE